MMLKTDWTIGRACRKLPSPNSFSFSLKAEETTGELQCWQKNCPSNSLTASYLLPPFSTTVARNQGATVGTHVEVNLENSSSTMLSSDSLALIAASARSCNFSSPSCGTRS